MTRTSFDHRPLTRLTALLAAGLTLPLLTGCTFIGRVFTLKGPQSTFETAGPVAKSQLDLFMITVWVTLFIFVVVGAALAYAQIKFRARTAADEKSEPPPQGHGNPLVEMGLIVASVVLLVFIAVPTVRGIWYTHDVPEEDKASAIDVTAHGYQWWFKFEYNGETAPIPGGGETPLVTANELVIPAGTPVRVHLRTVDVIHSFWVPKLAGKVDMMPNRANFLWLKADQPGYYYGQCAEYCGESHAIMKFRVIALSAGDYVRWLNRQKEPARAATAAALHREAGEIKAQFAQAELSLDRGATFAGSTAFDADPFAAWKQKQQPDAGENPALIARGRELFGAKTCGNCHTVRGHGFGGTTAPDLTHVGARTTIAAGVLENSAGRLAQWLHDPEYFKPGNKMVHGIGPMAGYLKLDANNRPVRDANGEYVRNIALNEAEVTALVAYLHSLK